MSVYEGLSSKVSAYETYYSEIATKTYFHVIH